MPSYAGKKKDNFVEKKLTQAQIAKNAEEAEKKTAKESNIAHQKFFHEENPNQKF